MELADGSGRLAEHRVPHKGALQRACNVAALVGEVDGAETTSRETSFDSWVAFSDPEPQSTRSSRIGSEISSPRRVLFGAGKGLDRGWECESIDSEGSTVATSRDDPESSESPKFWGSQLAHRPSIYLRPEVHDIVNQQERPTIIFDWDDTLFPRTFVMDVVRPTLHTDDFHVKLDESSPFYNTLWRHSNLIRELLYAASAVGNIAIITSSTRGWVPFSADRYLPGLDIEELQLALDLPVYYADEHADGFSSSVVWDREPLDSQVVKKRNAMAHCLEVVYENRDEPWRAISIGDSGAEKDAIKEVIRAVEQEKPPAQQPMCKTVKMMEWPGIDDLGAELRILHRWLATLDFSMCEVDDFLLDAEKLVSMSPDMPPIPPDLPPERLHGFALEEMPPLPPDAPLTASPGGTPPSTSGPCSFAMV